MILYIRGSLFLFVFVVTSLTITLLLTLLFWSPFGVRHRLANSWSWLNLKLLKLICGISHQTEGLDNIPEQGPAIAMGNHQSTWETIALPLFFQPTAWVLKRELMFLPIFGWGLATLKPISLKRGEGRKAIDQLLSNGKERLNENMFVVIFPEGTRASVDSELKYKIGGGLLANKSGAMIIPFAHNAGYFWPRHGLRKKAGVIKIVFGPPIDPGGKSAAAVLREVETWVRTTQERIKPGIEN